MSIINLNANYYYDDYIKDTNSLEEKFYPLLSKQSIGKSHDNRELIMIKVGYGKKNIFCCASVHGRESVNLIVLMKIIESYCEAYINKKSEKDFSFYQLLNQFSIYFIPLVNPDGYMIALKGFNQIKDPNLREYCKSLAIKSKEWKLNGRGVDINRNFPSITFRAKSRDDYCASENETKSLIKAFLSIPSIGFIDYHSRGKEIYYYRTAMPADYNKRQKEIAEVLKGLTNYSLVPIEDEIQIGDVGGNTVHYYSEYIYKPAITIETVLETEDFPLNIETQIETYDEIYYSLIGFGKLLVEKWR